MTHLLLFITFSGIFSAFRKCALPVYPSPLLLPIWKLEFLPNRSPLGPDKTCEFDGPEVPDFHGSPNQVKAFVGLCREIIEIIPS